MIYQILLLSVALFVSSNAMYLLQDQNLQTEPCKMTFTMTTKTGEIISGDMDYLFVIYRQNEYKIKQSSGYRRLAILAEAKYQELQVEFARNFTTLETRKRILSSTFWDFFEKQFELIGWILITHERPIVTITFQTEVASGELYPDAGASQPGSPGSHSGSAVSGGSQPSQPGAGTGGLPGSHSGSAGSGGSHTSHTGTGGSQPSLSGTGGSHSGTGTGGSHSGTGTGGSHSGTGGQIPIQHGSSSHSQSRYLPSPSDNDGQSQVAFNYTSEELY